MKSSFSLLETLIATLLLTITITTLLKMKDNNLFLLSSTANKDKQNGYISIHSVSNKTDDENIDFKKYINLNNNELRAELKTVKIQYKKELVDKFEFKLDGFELNFNIDQEKYTSDKLGNKTFYRVRLDD